MKAVLLMSSVLPWHVITASTAAWSPWGDNHADSVARHNRKEGRKDYICSSRLGLIRWYDR